MSSTELKSMSRRLNMIHAITIKRLDVRYFIYLYCSPDKYTRARVGLRRDVFDVVSDFGTRSSSRYGGIELDAQTPPGSSKHAKDRFCGGSAAPSMSLHLCFSDHSFDVLSSLECSIPIHHLSMFPVHKGR